MLPASRERVIAQLPEDASLLDVGGWAKPLSRADWVIDLMPYETRGMYGEADPDPERFDASTWVARDICSHEPWPFDDDQFDFVVCSHTLEDVRDPIRVCEEMCRVARAGYVEVPARIEEQARGIHGNWVGWSHHHWLVDVEEAGIQFVFKTAVLQGDHSLTIPAELASRLTADERVQTLWWEGGFDARERVFLGPGEIEGYLAEGIEGWTDRLTARGGRAPRRRPWRRR